MAIVRRTSNGVIETFSGTAGTGHTINLSDAAVGDVRFVDIAGNPDGTGTLGTLTLPTGWSWAGTQTETGAASTGMLSRIYRVVQSGDTLTSATLGLTYNNSVMVASVATTWEGVDNTTPLDQTVPAYTTGGSPPSSPSITTQTDGALVIVATNVDGAPTWGDTDIPSGTTLNGTASNNPPSNGQNIGSAYIIEATAGATGTYAWTNGGTEEYVASTVALRPAPEGITSVTPDEFDMDNADVDIESTGDLFDASGNDVYISDADTLAGSVNEVDISSAINTEAVGLINLDLTQLSDAELGNLHTLGPGARYIIVNATGGEYAYLITLHRPEAFKMSAGLGTPGASTARLTPPGVKTTGDFTAGRFEEAANPTTAVNIVADDYTELAWSIEAKLLSREETYDFRVTKNGVPIDTYTVTPQVTITAGITLVVADSSHSHTADAVVVTQKQTVVVQDASHSHAVDNVDLIPAYVVAVADSLHGHTVPNLDLTQKHTVATQETNHAHSVDEPVLVQGYVLASDDSLHGHASENVVLVQANTLVSQESLHGHTADEPVLIQGYVLASVDDSLHSHAVEAVALVQANTVAVADSLHSHLAEEPALAQANVLSTDDSLHGHTVPNLALTQRHQLAVEDGVHAHSVDSPSLVQANTLVSQESLHGHIGDNVTLSTAGVLNVAGSDHGHTVENVALTQSNVLASDDSLHGHTADNVVLELSVELVVADSFHGHTADNVVVEIAVELVVADSSHAHTADNVALSQGYVLVSDDTLHAHTADNVVVSTGTFLTVADSDHSHTVEAPSLTQANTLAAQESLHSHLADNVNLTQAVSLSVAESNHAHLSDEPVVSVKYILVSEDTTHNHTSDGIILTQSHLLSVDDALHAHAADNVALITAGFLVAQDAAHAHSAESIILILISLKIVTMVGKFKTGETVNVTVYDLDDNSVVVDDVAMAEILTLGYFKYKYQQLTDPTKEFLYIMDNGVFEQSGKLRFTNDELIGVQIPLPPSTNENALELLDNQTAP